MPPRERVRWSILINLAAFPGLGSILAGRRVGWAQAALMVSGFVLTMAFFLRYLWCCVLYLRSTTWDEGAFGASYAPVKWMLRYGCLLCAAAWLWAAVSSAGMWRRKGSLMTKAGR